MATVNDILAAIEHVKVCTGDSRAWLTGLTPDDVSAVATIFTAPPQRLETLLTTIRGHHPDLFDPTTGAPVFPTAFSSPQQPGGLPPAGQPSGGSDHQQGAAADAIRDAEAALAHQNSATAQLDLQVITAILNAHLTAVDGRQALDDLQHDVEAAVQTRTDLNTPAGARDFQRFLIGKLNDMHAVVARANLDDTSKSTLMAAWTSLYNASKTGQDDPNPGQPPRAAATGASSRGDSRETSLLPDAGIDPHLDALLADDPGPLPGDLPGARAPTAMPATPSLPSVGSPGMPSGATMPGSAPAWGAPGGFALPGFLPGGSEEPAPDSLDDEPAALDDSAGKDQSGEHAVHDENRAEEDVESPAAPESLPAGPTTVTLPDGDTVTAASPQLAAAIKAAAGGAPIADAFRQQGITIPPPGTAVTQPVDVSRVGPGDIGMFTDRHALALGREKALLNGQIQHISTVSGPSFLGWEHPPASATAPASGEAPTPTRPAAAERTSE